MICNIYLLPVVDFDKIYHFYLFSVETVMFRNLY